MVFDSFLIIMVSRNLREVLKDIVIGDKDILSVWLIGFGFVFIMLDDIEEDDDLCGVRCIEKVFGVWG